MGWEFVVSRSRRSLDGGIIVEGELTGTFEGSGNPAMLHLTDGVRWVPQAILGRSWTHYSSTPGKPLPKRAELDQGRGHLLLHGLEEETVAPGSILRGPLSR